MASTVWPVRRFLVADETELATHLLRRTYCGQEEEEDCQEEDRQEKGSQEEEESYQEEGYQEEGY